MRMTDKMDETAYFDRIGREIDVFASNEDIHALPEMFHYWSNRYVAPGAVEVFGQPSIANVYASAIRMAAPDGGARVISIGCGYGDTEFSVARELLAGGYKDFTILCVDLSPVLIGRLRENLPPELARHIRIMVADLNTFNLAAEFDCVMANHSLHHIERLEHIFDWAYASLTDTGVFATCDMIGRNGHMRWPEVEAFLQPLWALLPERQRVNVLLRRIEHRFINHDCSAVGFEGVRAQDILSLMLERFAPARFFGYGGLIDPFVDRAFGHNFKPSNPQDVAFIDAVATISDALLEAGVTKPTTVMAHFTKSASEEVCYRNRSARRSVRGTQETPEWAQRILDVPAVAPTPLR